MPFPLLRLPGMGGGLPMDWQSFIGRQIAAAAASYLNPSTSSGYKVRDASLGLLCLPAAANLVTDPQGTAQTFWPADSAHIDLTPNTDVPVALPAELAGLTKCIALVNDGSADNVRTANITVTASTDYYASLYVYAPTVGGTITITPETGHTFTLASITVPNVGWVRCPIYSPTVAGETTLALKVAFSGGTASTIYLTGAQVVQESICTPFFCGASTGTGTSSVAWSGTANASTSTRSVSRHVSTTIGTDMAAATAGTLAFIWQPIAVMPTATTPQRAVNILGGAAGVFTRAQKIRFILNGTDYIDSAAFGASLAPHVVVARYDSVAATMDLMVDGVASAQRAITGAITRTTYEIGGAADGAANGYLKAVVAAPVRHSNAWAATMSANSGTALSDRVTCFGNLAASDYMTPLVSDSVAVKKVVGLSPFLKDLTGNIVFDGDSLTGDVAEGVGTAMYQQAMAIVNTTQPQLRAVLEAVGGQKTTDVLANLSTVLARYDATKDRNIYSLLVGVNDYVAGIPGATTYANIVDICTQVRAAGFQVVVCTTTPAQDSQTYYTARRIFNPAIVANWATFADALANIAADPIIGQEGDEDNTTYYKDKTHMHTAGYAIAARYVAAAIESLL